MFIGRVKFMYWIKEMQNAVGYIEDRLTEELEIEAVARWPCVFPNGKMISNRRFKL